MAKTFSKYVYFDGKKSIPAWDVDSMVGWTDLSGNDAGQTVEARLYSTVAWFYRGVEDRGNNVGRMPFAIMTNGEEYDTSTDYANKLKFLPNPTTLFKLIELSIIMTGKAYLLKEVNSSGYIKNLRYLVPTSIKENNNKDTGELDYYSRLVRGREIRLTKEQVVAIYKPDYTVESGPGRSCAGRAALASANVLFNVDRFVAEFFERGAIKASILSFEGTSKEEADRAQHWYSDVVAGVKNAWSAIVIRSKMVTPIVIGEGLEGLENQTLTTERRQNIATALGVPESRMWSSAANYATRVQDDKAYFEGTILPECDLITEAFNNQVFNAAHHLDGYQLKFQYETLDIFQTDAADQAQALAQLRNSGVPLLMAMDLLGFDLTKEQRAELEQQEAPEETAPDEQPNDEPPMGETYSEPVQVEGNANPLEMRTALTAWQKKALYALKKGESPDVEFVTTVLPLDVVEAIHKGLKAATDKDMIKSVFAGVDLEAKKAAPVLVSEPSLAVALSRAVEWLEMANLGG